MKRTLCPSLRTTWRTTPDRSFLTYRVVAGTPATTSLTGFLMRHRIYGYTLGRKSEHRRGLLRNLAAGLFEHGEIRTTMPKAKAVQPFVERIITMARQGNLHARRQLEAKFGRDRWIHVWVADENVPSPANCRTLGSICPGLKTSSLMIVAKWSRPSSGRAHHERGCSHVRGSRRWLHPDRPNR